MNKVEKTVLVAHAAADMFNLVDAVEDYPKFLPWCSAVDLLERTETSTSATLHIDYQGLKQKFTTENIKVFPKSMMIKLKDGPFKSLDGHWHFIELSPNACKIEFELNYAFANHFLEKLISPVFSYITSTFVDHFVKQAEQLYTDKKD
jgi:ribosome-associated toxin RatA of RatAB toxin-antitoxin module